MKISVLNTREELLSFIQKVTNIKVFGAGFVCKAFFDFIEQNGFEINSMVESILVSDMQGNEEYINSISVQIFDKDDLNNNDKIFVAVSYKNVPYLLELFANKDIEIYYANFSISDCLNKSLAFKEVKNSISGFLNMYRNLNLSDTLNKFSKSEKYVWCCWWQGLENAPDIVKACIESQRKNLPEGAKYIVVTEKNYHNYIDIPSYIIEKVRKKYISLTTLSDIIRFSLLYKYGGLWIDSTVLLHKRIPVEWFDYNLFTCKGNNYHFGSYSQVSLWFIGGHAGNELFSFVVEAFLYYYKYNDKIKYYLMVDYLIAAGFEYIEKSRYDYSIIPINNESADVLKKHLCDKFDKVSFNEYISDSYLQKLTYKFNISSFNNESIYRYLINKYYIGEAK